MKISGTCKEASRLMVQRELGRLPLWQNLRLRLHLWACTGCVRFQSQMRLMSRASAQWRHYQGDDDDGR